jgi:Rrf2 family protein
MSGLLRISEAANLGLHAMAFLAASQTDEKTSVAEISKHLEVSKEHLGKVLQRLNKLGLLRSHKGPGGGFTLAKARDKITLLEILEAIDGPLPTAACLLAFRECPHKRCSFGNLLASVEGSVRSHLSQTRLSDVAPLRDDASREHPADHGHQQSA